MKREHVEAIDSTNAELMRRAASGEYQVVCLSAKRQTTGRGRLGRVWVSEHESLMFSLGLVLHPKEWLGLSLVVGLSIAQSLHEKIRVKWPNDLLMDGKKLAGILIETTAVKGAVDGSRYVVIGVGINLEPPKGVGLARAATGLYELLPAASAEHVLAQLLSSLQANIADFAVRGYSPFQEAFAVRDALKGSTVTLSNGVSGTACGTDVDGALLVQTTTGLERIVSHEVSTQLG